MATITCVHCSRVVAQKSLNHRYCTLRCRFAERAIHRRRLQHPKPISPLMLAVLEGIGRGLTQGQIARQQGCSRNRVAQLLRRARERGMLPWRA